MASGIARSWLRPNGSSGSEESGKSGETGTSEDVSGNEVPSSGMSGLMSRFPLANNYWSNPTGSRPVAPTRGGPKEYHYPSDDPDDLSIASSSSSRSSSRNSHRACHHAEDEDQTVRQRKRSTFSTPVGIGSPRKGQGLNDDSHIKGAGTSPTLDYGDSISSHLLGRSVPSATTAGHHAENSDEAPGEQLPNAGSSWTGYDWNRGQPSISGFISHTIQKTRSGLNFVSAGPVQHGDQEGGRTRTESTSPRRSGFPFMMRTNSQPGTKRGNSGTMTPPSELLGQPGRGALLVRSRSTDGAIEDPNLALSTRHLHQAIQLANTAMDEQSSWVARNNISKAGNTAAASAKSSASSSGDLDYILDVYLSALEYLMKALPKELLDMDQERRQRVRIKMIECLERLGLVDEAFVKTVMGRGGMDTALLQGVEGDGTRTRALEGPSAGLGDRSLGPRTPSITWQEAIISMAITSAVALKKSPIPGLATKGFTWTVKSAAALDTKYAIHDRLFQASSAVLTKALDLDREYDIHVRLAEVIYVFYQATIRAMVAFARAEAYDETGGVQTTEMRLQRESEEARGKEEIRRAMEVLGQAGVDVVGLMQNQPQTMVKPQTKSDARAPTTQRGWYK